MASSTQTRRSCIARLRTSPNHGPCSRRGARAWFPAPVKDLPMQRQANGALSACRDLSSGLGGYDEDRKSRKSHKERRVIGIRAAAGRLMSTRYLTFPTPRDHYSTGGSALTFGEESPMLEHLFVCIRARRARHTRTSGSTRVAWCIQRHRLSLSAWTSWADWRTTARLSMPTPAIVRPRIKCGTFTGSEAI